MSPHDDDDDDNDGVDTILIRWTLTISEAELEVLTPNTSHP